MPRTSTLTLPKTEESRRIIKQYKSDYDRKFFLCQSVLQPTKHEKSSTIWVARSNSEKLFVLRSTLNCHISIILIMMFDGCHEDFVGNFLARFSKQNGSVLCATSKGKISGLFGSCWLRSNDKCQLTKLMMRKSQQQRYSSTQQNTQQQGEYGSCLKLVQ